MSINIKSIHSKLNEARVRLQDMNLKKSGYNKFAGFKYFELADFLPAVNKIMRDLGICAVFSIEESERADVDGKRATIATLRIVNSDAALPYESITFASPIADAQLKGCTPLQGIGAIHTYMKRYLYLNAFEIIEYDALDFKAGEAIEEPFKSSTLEPEVIEIISKIKHITELNDVYIRMAVNKPENNEWKWLLNEKAKAMKCTFDKENKRFIMDDKDQIKFDFQG